MWQLPASKVFIFVGCGRVRLLLGECVRLLVVARFDDLVEGAVAVSRRGRSTGIRIASKHRSVEQLEF